MNDSHPEGSGTTMVTFDCPWCAEPAMVDAGEPGELTCEACGVAAELAPDPVGDRFAHAA
jgi:hypothetical protein